jgi:hypothetical protein
METVPGQFGGCFMSLSREPIRETSDATPVDTLERRRRCFHPLARGWPSQPPNHPGFRYDGEVKAVHHVEGVEVVTANLATLDPAWPETDETHVLYRPGPPMRPGAARSGTLAIGAR